VCLRICLSLAAFPHYCTDPDVTRGNGRGCPLVLHHCADLQPVHEFRCCYNTHACKLALYTANAYSAEREMSASACTAGVHVSWRRGIQRDRRRTELLPSNSQSNRCPTTQQANTTERNFIIYCRRETAAARVPCVLTWHQDQHCVCRERILATTCVVIVSTDTAPAASTHQQTAPRTH